MFGLHRPQGYNPNQPSFPKGGAVNLNLNWTSIRSFLRQGAAVAGLFVTIANTDHLPLQLRTAVATVSGLLLTAEHYANAVNPTTPPNSPPPAPPS
jgi:hypothetical protein